LESYFTASRNVVVAQGTTSSLQTQSSDSAHSSSLPERKRIVSCTIVSGECDSPPPLEIFQLPLQVASVAREPAAATATITSSYIAASQGPPHTVTSADSTASQGPCFATLQRQTAYFASQEQTDKSTTYFSPTSTSAVPLTIRLTPTPVLLALQRQASFTSSNFGAPQRSTRTYTPHVAAIPQSERSAGATSSHVAAPQNNIIGTKTKKEAKPSPAVNPNLEFETVQNEMLDKSNVTGGHNNEFNIDNGNEDSLGIAEAVNLKEADVSFIVDFTLGTKNRKTSDTENQELELDFTFEGL
jgi:hypothetical protein